MSAQLQTVLDLAQQTIKVFVPGIGIVEGIYQAATTGDPRGAAKVFVPGIGIAEATIAAGADVWELSPNPVRLAVGSTASLAVLLTVVGIVAVVMLRR